jgi:hypothetical protein
MRARGRSGRSGPGEKRLAVCSGVEWVGISGVSGRGSGRSSSMVLDWTDRWGGGGGGCGRGRHSLLPLHPCSLAFPSIPPPCRCPAPTLAGCPPSFLCGARVTPLALAFALRPRRHHWVSVSGLETGSVLRRIERGAGPSSFLAAGFSTTAAASSSLAAAAAAAAAVLRVGAGHWCSLLFPPACLLNSICGVAAAGVDGVVVAPAGRCSARRDPAVVRRHALPCRHQLRRYRTYPAPLSSFVVSQVLTKCPHLFFGVKDTHTCPIFSIRQHSFFFGSNLLGKPSLFLLASIWFQR